jgi:alkylhydroperoxidase family enzyme
MSARDTYVEKVRKHAYKVVDADIDDLRAEGMTEDDIFELTVDVARDEGQRRLDIVNRLLEG